jgi:hypothetical protein
MQRPPYSREPSIRFGVGAEDNGLASMVAGLIEQNLADRPDKRADFARLNGRVAIVAEDAGVALTLEFARGSLTVHDGIVGVPDVSVRASSDDVVNLSLVELLPRIGLPDPRGPYARQVFQGSRDGRIRVYGALGHLPLMLRLTRVMSVK